MHFASPAEGPCGAGRGTLERSRGLVMEFFKPGRVFDFMGVRWFWIPLSFILVIISTILCFVPGPNYGTDFRGGTEVEVAFKKPIDASGVRNAVHAVGFQTPDVVQVADPH